MSALFIIVILMSLWLIFAEEIAVSPYELHSPWRVDIRNASRAQLMILPGIGPTLADRILAYRATHTLNSAYDLSQIKGIGPMTVEDVRRLIVIEENGS